MIWLLSALLLAAISNAIYQVDRHDDLRAVDLAAVATALLLLVAWATTTPVDKSPAPAPTSSASTNSATNSWVLCRGESFARVPVPSASQVDLTNERDAWRTKAGNTQRQLEACEVRVTACRRECEP